jgi:hypothetical protein
MEPWERVLAAMVLSLFAIDRTIHADEFRRCREDLGNERYQSLTYLQVWAEALLALMYERGVFTPEEVRARMNGSRGPT